MSNRSTGILLGLLGAALLSVVATATVAQTTVTTTNGGTVSTVPVFTSNKNVENSVITQSNGNVGIGSASISPWAAAYKVTDLYSGHGFVYGSSNATGFGDVNYGQSGWGNNTYFNGSQSFSIGTGAASELLQGGGVLLFGNAPSVSAGSLQTFITRFFINNVGNVGIGTTTPMTPLEVNGSARVDGTLTVSGTGGLEVQTGGVTFPDGSFQSTAYPASSSGGNAPILVENNEAVINSGINASGTGIKHVRTNGGCTTPNQYNQTCTIPVTWPGNPFADTNYTVSCTPKLAQPNIGAGQYVPPIIYIRDQDKSPNSMNVTVFSGERNGDSHGAQLHCDPRLRALRSLARGCRHFTWG